MQEEATAAAAESGQMQRQQSGAQSGSKQTGGRGVSGGRLAAQAKQSQAPGGEHASPRLVVLACPLTKYGLDTATPSSER